MADLEDYLAKTTAIGVICAAANCSRPTAEKALWELEAAGRIKLVKASFSHSMLLSRADMDTIIAYIRQERGTTR
jgi:hypothetical protein